MMASRSLSLSVAWSKPGIFCSGHWRTDAGLRISFFSAADLEIVVTFIGRPRSGP